MKNLPIYIFLLIIFSNCGMRSPLFSSEKIILSKDMIGQRRIYKIITPNKNSEKRVLRYVGGHGHGFAIMYNDSSQIYYTNDDAIATPNYKNYQSIHWKGKQMFDTFSDTIIEGRQSNGKYWKEIIKGNDFIGYLNISEEEKSLFDHSLQTFQK